MTLMITLDPFADARRSNPSEAPFAFPHADWGRELFGARDRRASRWLNSSAADFLVCFVDGCAQRLCARSISSRHWENETELAPTFLLCFKRVPAQPLPALEGA
jgi:hypothetical protein